MFRFCVVCCVWLLGNVDDGTPGTTASNITSDGAAGIGPIRTLPAPSPMAWPATGGGSPMAYAFCAGLKPADLADIIAYLHTVPPLQ